MLFAALTLNFISDKTLAETAAAGMMAAVIKNISEIHCKGRQHHLTEEDMY